MGYSDANKKAAKEYVAKIRAATVCESCGKQPFDWHSDRHLIDENLRVSRMASRGHPIAVIQAEIDQCQAMCRSCHMKEDGRMIQLRENCPNKKGVILVGLLPCIACSKLEKPLRKGHCNVCYKRHTGAVKTACTCGVVWG